MTENTPQADAPPPEPAPEDVVKQAAENESPDLPLPASYTKAELDVAAEEIKTLTPESWIEIVRAMHGLEDTLKANLGEAPGIAWTTLYSEKTGGQMNVTSRGITPKAAAEDMFATVRYIMLSQPHMGWSPTKSYAKAPSLQTPAPAQNKTPPPAAPNNTPPPPAQGKEPTYAPVAGSGIEKFTVQSIQHAISKNNHPYVLVKTVEPAFGKFGVNAWKEVVPVDFEAWPVGQEYQPSPEMKFCLVDTGQSPKKVTAFTPE